MATNGGSFRSSCETEPKKSAFNEGDSARNFDAQQLTRATTPPGATEEQQIDGPHNEAAVDDMILKIKPTEPFFGHEMPNVHHDTLPLTDGASHASAAAGPIETPKRVQKVIIGPRAAKKAARVEIDSLVTEKPATTKSGRKSAARKVSNDTVEGQEYEEYMSMRIPDDGNNLDGDYVPSSPVSAGGPTYGTQPNDHRSTTHHTALTPVKEILFLGGVSEDDGEELALTYALTEGFEKAKHDNRGRAHPFFAKIDPQIHRTVADLAAWDETLINLPASTEGVWTAKELTHMYISAYSSQHWNLCDLIADTWIRAFQDLNKSDTYIWRPNKNNWVYMSRNAENFGLEEVDPPLDSQICAFEAELLNNLYYHTDKDCGARMLWADSMALCGAEWEDELTGPKRRHNKWHPDIFYNVMCTSLRLVRRKLTLKIEESTEGAWCKRYHMHSVHGLPCYRRLARDAKQRKNLKRRAEEMDGEDAEQIRPAKRVSFANDNGDLYAGVSEEE